MPQMSLQCDRPQAAKSRTGNDAFGDSLEAARSFVERRRRHGTGIKCPCCGLLNKVYSRKLNSGMARFLIRLYHAGYGHPGRPWHKFVWSQTANGDYSKLRYWNLIEKKPDCEGYWRITGRGVQFVLGRIAVAKYCHVFNARAMGFSVESTTIKQALGDKFNYHDLLEGVSIKDDLDIHHT